ncbi:MAG: ATP-binding protein [Myxococcaceae bacterium]|nr:ATP-binding protein [Myxococcaceae bacterium]
MASVYAAALLSETTAPGLPGRQVKRLSVQQGALGHPLDDVIVEGEGVDGVRMRLSLQVKRKLVISSAQTNTDFRETVLRAHATVAGTEFKVGLDRVGVVTGEIADGNKRSFETLCDWARADSDVTSFVKKLRTDGVAGEKETHFDDIRNILSSKIPEVELDAATHRLLSHFVLMRFEMLHEGSVIEAQTVSSLSNHLHPADRTRADDLWRRLLALVRVSEGQAAVFDRKTLVARLNGAFRLTGAPSMQATLSRVAEEARHAVADIGNDIAGVNIPRNRFVQRTREALTQHRFVQIGGLPGTGKSVVLRSLVEEALANGPALFLKADRLTGATWSQYATATGLGATSLEEFLVEHAALGSSTVFVDGLDRVEVGQRGVLLDIFNTLLSSPLLRTWRVVATVRDTGIEPLRTWLPSRLLGDGVPVIEVTEFDDTEARLLAKMKPTLAPLLFGSEQVRAIVRRPFFAGVLIRRHGAETSVPNSEIELATAWWVGGGYGAEVARSGHRRAALVGLAQAGAATLGRRIPVLGVDPQALEELEALGVVRHVRTGQTVRFAHDIYFEWSFLQLLVSRGEHWLAVVRQVGEPPVLGRTVELLSQAEFRDRQDWQKHLELLEGTTDVRSQWLRAWMVGPFGLPSFQTHESTYNAAMFADGAKRVAKLVVWFQAEKTKANPMALDGKFAPGLELTQRLLLADSLAWPSDIDSWQRCCYWLLRRIGDIPVSIRPDVVAVFDVWQNAFSNIANPVSGQIVSLTKSWLMDIETRLHGRTFPKDRGEWEQLEWGEPEALEERLREMLLRASRAYAPLAIEYLSHLQTMEHLPRSAIEQILTCAPIISVACLSQLADFVLRAMLRPLPEEIVRRSSRSSYRRGIHSDDWQSLSIDDHHQFFPCAPTREPFPSLFSHAPHEARRLVCQLANHAIAAWRQLHRLDYEHRGTPIALTLSFPWGQQTFWGGTQQYQWSRGTWGSHVVGSGLMALEVWAFKEVEKGRPVDEVLRDVLQGHESVAALGVAVSIALQTRHCSEITLPLLTSQRIWVWDIERCVSDTSHSSNLIGFEPKDRRHYDAVVEGNKRQCRRLDVRWLASVCVLSGGDLGARASEAITKFVDDLPFDYAEERGDSGTIQHLKRTAEIWAEVGKRTNYRATSAEDGSGVLIQLDNPKAQGPDIDAINQQQAEMVEHLTLLNWIHDCFQKDALEDGLTLAQAIERARRLDTPALFEEAHAHVSSVHRRQSAVVGVAAVVLRLGRCLPSPDLEWGADVCLRAWKTPGAPENFFLRGSILLDHPVLYAARGLTALVRYEPTRQDALEALLQLAAHPYEQIATEALGGLLGQWDRRPDIAWLALGLAVSLSIVEQPPHNTSWEQRREQEQRHVEAAVSIALTRSKALEELPQPLPNMPPAWVEASEGRRFRRGRRGKEAEIEWEHPMTNVDWHLLAKVLAMIPVPTVMADELRRDIFLSWCDGLVGWTVERLYPTWSRQPGQEPFEVASTELYEWRRELYRFLARVSLHLDPKESARRFVEPAAATDDETFTSLVESYVSLLTYNIMDEPVLPRTPLILLELIVPRLLSHGGWSQAKWNDGTLYDVSLSRLIKAVFFVEAEKALGAARFANGNWTDIASILPIVEPILAAQGQNPTVSSTFLTLCERAFESYPVDRFVVQLPMVLSRSEGMPLGWRGTSLPARLAGLIQRFSEKTQPLPAEMARALLRALDALVDMGNRRAAAIQTSEVFKDVRTTGSAA